MFSNTHHINSNFLLSSLTVRMKILHRALSHLPYHQLTSDIGMLQENMEKKSTKNNYLQISLKHDPRGLPFLEGKKTIKYYGFLTNCASEVSTAVLICPFSFSWIH